MDRKAAPEALFPAEVSIHRLAPGSGQPRPVLRWIVVGSRSLLKEVGELRLYPDHPLTYGMLREYLRTRRNIHTQEDADPDLILTADMWIRLRRDLSIVDRLYERVMKSWRPDYVHGKPSADRGECRRGLVRLFPWVLNPHRPKGFVRGLYWDEKYVQQERVVLVLLLAEYDDAVFIKLLEPLLLNLGYGAGEPANFIQLCTRKACRCVISLWARDAHLENYINEREYRRKPCPGMGQRRAVPWSEKEKWKPYEAEDCCVCMERTADAFTECGPHIVLCMTCAKELTACPICDVPIRGILRMDGQS